MTEVTTLAAAALAVRDALERVDGSVREARTGLHVIAVAESEADERLVRRIVDEVARRFGVRIELELEWR